MKKTYENKIKLFAALAGSVSVMSAAEAQTIVTRDINPDAVIDGTNTTYDLDIDNDGNIDFYVSRNGYSGHFFYFAGTGNIGYNLPTPGMSNAHTFVSQNGSDWYVARLNVGDTTTFTSEYNDNRYTRLFRVDNANVLTDDFQWTSGTTDKYIGVQFTIGNNVHFGWVKVDVSADYSSITIKEVGYESSPGALMKAGATASADKATNVTAVDAGNNGNASDIQVSFTKAANESNIQKYRIHIVPTAQLSSDTLAMVQLLAANRYQDVAKTGSNISVTLNAGLLDIFGDAVVTGTPYTVVVESVGNNSTGDALSAGSTSITTGTKEGESLLHAVVADRMNINFQNLEQNGQVKVISAIGTEVYKGAVASGNSTINLEEATPGIYTVQLTINEVTAYKKLYLNK